MYLLSETMYVENSPPNHIHRGHNIFTDKQLI